MRASLELIHRDTANISIGVHAGDNQDGTRAPLRTGNTGTDPPRVVARRRPRMSIMTRGGHTCTVVHRPPDLRVSATTRPEQTDTVGFRPWLPQALATTRPGQAGTRPSATSCGSEIWVRPSCSGLRRRHAPKMPEQSPSNSLGIRLSPIARILRMRRKSIRVRPLPTPRSGQTGTRMFGVFRHQSCSSSACSCASASSTSAQCPPGGDTSQPNEVLAALVTVALFAVSSLAISTESPLHSPLSLCCRGPRARHPCRSCQLRCLRPRARWSTLRRR